MEPLVRRAQRGDAAALEQLVQELTPFVGRICGPIALGDGDDAVQETLLAVVRNLGSLREPAALHAWVRTIAVREAVRVAGRGRAVPVDPNELVAVAAVDAADTAVDVHQVLEELSPQHRAVLVLRELEGFNEAEAAQLLGVSLGTVKSRTARAKKAFLRRWTS
jgi:RNA polymerase sigma-70 factor (ECF subfamily)